MTVLLVALAVAAVTAVYTAVTTSSLPAPATAGVWAWT